MKGYSVRVEYRQCTNRPFPTPVLTWRRSLKNTRISVLFNCCIQLFSTPMEKPFIQCTKDFLFTLSGFSETIVPVIVSHRWPKVDQILMNYKDIVIYAVFQFIYRTPFYMKSMKFVCFSLDSNHVRTECHKIIPKKKTMRREN